jgi:hypothetical protein
MSVTTRAGRALAAIRRHPARTAAVCAPLLAAGILGGSTIASAAPAPTLAVPPAALHAGPAPHVLLFGNDRRTPTPTPTVTVTAPVLDWHVTGCDSDYGTAGQCVPWTIPGSSSRARCAWLRSNGFGPLPVAGTNRQGLMENGRGYVCASGT